MGTALVAGAVAVSGFQEKFFQASEATINFAVGPGNGTPLVLLHGLGRDWKSFSVLLPELSSRFQVFAIDLRGHGKSSHIPRGYRITQFAQDISEFMGAMLPSGTAVFGHSLGAMVGLSVAARENCRVKALIVGDTMISPAKFATSMYAPLFRQLYKLMQAGGSEEELARGIGTITLQVPGIPELLRIEELPGNDEATLLEWARGAMLADPDALAMTVDGSAFVAWRPDEILPRITCPTLLLQGNPELEALLSDEDVELACRLLPRVECVKFPLLGHALFMQQPAPVLRAVSAFLRKLED